MLCPRAAESSDSPTIHPKQAKVEKTVVQELPENGECLVESRKNKAFQITAVEAGAAATPTAKSSSCKDPKQQGGTQASLQEEDPERMKHSKIRARGYTGSGGWRGWCPRAKAGLQYSNVMEGNSAESNCIALHLHSCIWPPGSRRQ